MELQIIHKDIFGNVAAVSVFFKVDLERNDFLYSLGFGIDDEDNGNSKTNKIVDLISSNPLYSMRLRNHVNIPLKNNDKFNLGPLLNKKKGFVEYVGSLTTPPCTNKVKWVLVVDKFCMTEEQLADFPVLFGRSSNVRGLQSKDKREITIA